jgi:ATP-dependent Clp protease ATP-binding subunit ClpA
LRWFGAIIPKGENRLAQKDLYIHFDESVVDFVADNGFNQEYGARPVQRVINDFVIEGISTALLQGGIKNDMPVTATVQNNEFILK